MRVLVCGSRDVPDAAAARAAIVKRMAQLPASVVVVHGGARGVDTWADAIAWSNGYHVEKWLADWDAYGRSAGLCRNLAMLNSGVSLVLAFWDGSSRGTLHTITEAKARGIPVEVIPLEPA